ncbi:PREDICTED: FACT complex subunit SPT16-like [Amphimedon queenslandica]|uniref:FACT complex subunit n=1 Tax=Amphimedon queenslandica TaxID=400682 RepID=A0A1X7VC59_AMPQE|nr:PREDICTED: FACT complex subunit SPT16-like [Amphimedon queenslandica]|eukprot:XP_003384743.1 PREDICTED: FACT complex subunit SPT16-like [Amphimedon queenslandica]
MVSVDVGAFMSRVERLYTDWESEEDTNLWNEVDCVAVIVGRDEEVLYAKSTALQTWLFGYELTDTLCLFCANEIHILTSKKKAEFLKPVEGQLEKKSDLPNLVIHLRNKGDNDQGNFEDVIKAAKGSKRGKKVGVFIKDEFTGDFIEGWTAALKESSLKQIDVSAAFAYVSAPKDDKEVEIIKKACQIAANVFSKHVRKEIATIVDEEKKVKHSRLADGIDKAITDDKKLLPAGVDSEQVEICYAPIIQSGGKYQLKFSTVSNDDRLHFGTIICSLGVRYKSYCSNICRTMFVEPTQEMQDNYSFLLSLYEKTLEFLKVGVPLSEVYNDTYRYVESQRPDLIDHFVKTIGFATGLEFREAFLQISPKCNISIVAGMVFCVNLGFSNLTNSSSKDDQGKVYALFIGDVVLVNKSGPATELSSASKKKLRSIAIFFGDDDEQDKGEENINPELFSGKESRLLDTRTRTEIPSEDRRKEHQAQLKKQINEEAKKRLLDGMQDNISKRPKLSSMVAYKHPSVLPVRENDVQNLHLYVDRKHEAVILPIYGVPVPIHISMIKNISKSEEGSYTYLRINLFHPGSTMGRMDGVVFPNPEASFVKELSFRGYNSASNYLGGGGISLVGIFHSIKELQKKFRTREQEKRELEGYHEQDSLIVSSSKGNPRLKDLFMRPVIGQRRIQGVLEAHTNGLRYTNLRGDHVDIIYNNIKHAFFQPSKGEMIVLLHFHLKHPIIIGKKKQADIQFYTEVGEIMTDLGRNHHMHDRDDLLAEQTERELRQKLDNAFDSFRRKVEQMPQCHVDFEKPFRDLGYPGVPFRSTVFLMPTANCLVNLTEQPPFIVTLDEVELVHFERVQFQLKNFDMVLVFKDYKRKVSMVASIPMKNLDQVKEWLNSCDIRYTEGVQSLSWAKIMKTINEDPEGFFESGGWSFLDPESDEEEEDESSESDEYQPSDDGDMEVGDESEEEDSDENYTSISEGDESDYEDSEEDEESGKDWDELEEEARKADRAREEPEPEPTPRKRKHSKMGNSRPAPPPSKKAAHKSSPKKRRR